MFGLARPNLRAKTWRNILFLSAMLILPSCDDGDAVTDLAPTTPGPAPVGPAELFELGDFALHIPAAVPTVRGILLALGGPDTRGFVSNAPFGAPIAEVEASLEDLGQGFQSLARSHGLAVLGTSLAALQDGPESDRLLLDAIEEAAAISGHAELTSAPLLLYGMSGGAPQAAGFTARNPGRVAGLFLKVPTSMASLTSGEVLGVPTFVVLAERDRFVDNAALTAAFEGNRRAGALWALALEPDVHHHSLSPSQRKTTFEWMRAILGLRLGAAAFEPLRTIDESSGWLGNPTIGEVWPWANYPGDQGSASWFPSREIVQEWQTLIGAPLRVDGTIGAWFQRVLVSRAGQAVTNAVVTVNGVPIPQKGFRNLYEGVLPEALPPGSPIALEVRAASVTVKWTSTVPEIPVITSPTTGTAFAPTDQITVTWKSATDPAAFEVCLDCWENSLDPRRFSASGASRELNIAAGSIGPGDHHISVAARNHPELIGLWDWDSSVLLESVEGGVGFEITQ